MKDPISPATRPHDSAQGQGAGPAFLTRAVREAALRAGFLAVGITSPESLHSRGPELRKWLSNGYSGGLSYMEKFLERQASLLGGFPDLRSIVVLATAYGPAPEPANRPSEPAGRVARYAHGRDYHRAIRKRIRRLESEIRSLAGGSARTLHTIDKGPVQERALAEAAGLGFIGKSTMLIHPKAGSFLFLAAVLTNLELMPDQPLAWDCGSCTLCLEACPTEALVEPYQLDAGRCIANLTIENRGDISPPFRTNMQDWVFGCDICQEVCPYNRAKEPPVWPEFSPKSGAGALLSLAGILSCRTKADYESLFAGTPLMRAKRPSLLRNAAIAAGNMAHPRLFKPLSDALQADSDPMVRSHAAWALGKLGGKDAVQVLETALTKETDPAAREEIRKALQIAKPG